MRAMLVANIDVPNRFANGAIGRIVHWGPEAEEGDGMWRKVQANAADVQVRFYHEDSYQSKKRYCLPGIDFIDITPRREIVGAARGQPSMLQLTIQPAYALTIHKVQALTLRKRVNGCFEGVFAHGQIYVLVSRVTDLRNLQAVGLPPADFLEAVARA